MHADGSPWPMDTTDDTLERDLDDLDERLTSTSNVPTPDQARELLAQAQRLHTQEMAKYAERKRKRQERKSQAEMRQRKVDDEVVRLHAAVQRREASNSGLYRLFSDLQAMDSTLGLRCPELVVVGMQSDGKSTFVEALLGFTFNVVSSNIGTRRPLVIQMVNSKDHPEPHCRFQSEESDAFADAPTPVAQLSSEIMRRTNQIAGADKSRVSSKPIILRVQYSKV